MEERLEEEAVLMPVDPVVVEPLNGSAERPASPEPSEIKETKPKKKTGEPISKRISPLWLHFEDDGKRASCLYCDSKLVHHSSTTPLKNHLSAKHPERLPPGVLGPKMIRIATKTGSTKDLDKILVKALVRDLRPLSEADGALVHIISQVTNQWEIPKRDVLRDQLEQIFVEYQQKLHELVTSECSGLSLSLEAWTSSKDVNQRFLSVYGHFLNRSFQPVSVVLGVEGLKDFEDETAANAAREVLLLFNLDAAEHVSCIVAPESSTDNTPTVNMAGVAMQLGVPYEQCLTSFLKNVIHEILAPHAALLSTVRSLVSQIKCNHHLSQRFSNMQRDVGNEHALTLFHDHPTRILSSYDMLARLTELRPVLTDFIATVPQLPSLNEAEWTTCERISQFLLNFKDLSEELNAEKFLSVPIATISVLGWQKLQSHPNRDPIIEALRTSTIELFEKKIPPAIPFLIATGLDPRWKHLPSWNPEYVTIVRTEINNKAEEIKLPPGTDLNIKAEADDDASSMEPPPAKRRKRFSEAVEGVNQYNAEVTAYLQEPRLITEANPLEWWQDHAQRFPKLALLARRYLPIPASATSSLTLSTRRAALGTSSVRKIVMLNRNMDVLDGFYPTPGQNGAPTNCGAMTTVSPDQGITVVTHSHHDHHDH